MKSFRCGIGIDASEKVSGWGYKRKTYPSKSAPVSDRVLPVERTTSLSTRTNVIYQGGSIVDEVLKSFRVCRVRDRNAWGNHVKELGERFIEIGNGLVIRIHLYSH